MPPPFDAVAKIHPPREAWRLKVRVLRLWIIPSFGNHDVPNSMVLILLDEDSTKIQATIKKQLLNRFKEQISEGQVYQMSYFSVVPNQGGYQAAEHEFKLIFLNRTTLVPITDDAIPRSCLSLYQFSDILNMVDDHEY
ncbi:hypothetical protein PIB30_101896 [Stylosanthes scabra]|uniref:Replication protein A 70 kDa DNA-binding subunit B/D first OB fold domain-containing protein n=1 Tax=Stylosanthes scabra TaxID=79078 RepID=A0ABU6XZY6_9FABA|nr:hypothetical protein [Stylosanthes scabra]